MAAKIRKGDKVIITTGKDKGKQGEVLKVLVDANKALVSGLNNMIKHVKPSRKMPEGGIIKMEAPINLSNLMHVDPKLGSPTRIGFKLLNDGKKVRYAKKSGEIIDN